MPNRLASETSPYLLQHADNPVDWYPWGDEAFARARAEDKPLLVSIGYAACHWCHVMEHESFEDAEVALVMNDALRVREGRPRGAPRRRRDPHGRRPGHDRPRRLAAERVPHARGRAVLRRHLLPARGRGPGMPSWRDVLVGVWNAWTTQRAEIEQAAQNNVPRLQGARVPGGARGRGLRRRARRRRSSTLRRQFDEANGGWGGAPKFPAASVIEFLLARGEVAMPLQTLRRMASGGIYDQVGGGFARYSVDATLARPALREDALRQRAAGPGLPARVPGHRRAAVPARVRGDARLGDARAAPGRRRLRVVAGRRLRRRRGQVLRVDARGVARGAGR